MNPSQNTNSGSAANDEQQFLTFSLAGEEYGIDILKVQEIKGYSKTTRVPNSPLDVVGVLNLRGTIVPIVDLRRRFGLEPGEYTSVTAIVVVVVQGRVMGMIVDKVSEVVSISSADIQPPASCGSGTTNHFLKGMGKLREQLVILLDVDAVLIDVDGSDITNVKPTEEQAVA